MSPVCSGHQDTILGSTAGVPLHLVSADLLRGVWGLEPYSAALWVSDSCSTNGDHSAQCRTVWRVKLSTDWKHPLKTWTEEDRHPMSAPLHPLINSPATSFFLLHFLPPKIIWP